jgi:hypothetical protein
MKSLSRYLVWCLAAFVAVVFVLIVTAYRPPVAATLEGIRRSSGFCEAVVTLKNHSGRPIRCEGIFWSRLDRVPQLEVGRLVTVALDARGRTNLTVPIPFDGGPGRISCYLRVVSRHPAPVRSAGALLQKRGLHLYHSGLPQPSVANPFRLTETAYASARLLNLRLKLGGPPPFGSLPDWLVFQCYTNAWTMR